MSPISLFPAQLTVDCVFSIIIPTWNNLVFVKKCIESIRKNSSFKHQIIVHVNDGSDGTLEWIKQQGIDYSWSPSNAGICLPMNACRSLVKTKYIVYMNDDMYVCPLWDFNLNEEIKLISSNKFYLSSTLIEPVETGNNAVIAPCNYGKTIDSFEEDRLLKEYSTFIHADWNGASWPPSLMHVETWDLIGGFSVEFSPGMYSDPDISMKLYHAGVRVFKGVGSSRVYHFMSKSTGKVKRNNGRKQFLFKWNISSRLFYDHILKIGSPYKQLPESFDEKLFEKLTKKSFKKKILMLFKK